MRDPVLTQHREEILRLAREHRISRVRIFGSRARGDGTEASDIDLLVLPDVGCSLLDLIGLQQDIEELTTLEVDVVSENGLSPYLRDEILNQAIPL